MALHIYSIRGEDNDGIQHTHTRLRFIALPDPAAAILPDGHRHHATHHIRLSIWSAVLLLLWIGLASILPGLVLLFLVTIFIAGGAV